VLRGLRDLIRYCTLLLTVLLFSESASTLRHKFRILTMLSPSFGLLKLIRALINIVLIAQRADPT